MPHEALKAVQACEEAGIVLSVNQNMRYDQSVRAAKTLLDSDQLGTPVIANIDMRGIPHWMPGHPMGNASHVNVGNDRRS